MVDWRKEIKLSDLRPGKVDADSPAPLAAEQSEKPPLLQKEISLRRAPKPPRAAAPKDEDDDSEETTSLLKKEISFRRKSKPLPEDASEPRRPKKEPKRAARARSHHKRVKRVVGLKIGGSQIAAARVVNNGFPELVQIAREPLEHSLVVAGELREPEPLADALRAFFRKHKLPKQGVRLGIANNRIGVRIFEIAGIKDPRQLENAVRFRAQEVLPIPIDEAVLDYQILDERVDDEGNPVMRIMLVVAYRKLIDRYVVACRKAGLKLVGIDLEAFALLRALAEPRTDEEGAA